MAGVWSEAELKSSPKRGTDLITRQFAVGALLLPIQHRAP